jgi:outer membrane lipoprotein-sorting protein
MNKNSKNKTNLSGIFGVFFLFSFSALFAQSDKQAEQIIADFIKSVEQNAVQADFEMTVLDENNRITQVQNGTFRMKRDKFSLITDDIHIFFDGKTQWTYMDAVGEVTITEPSGNELVEINPIFMLREYQNNSTIRFSTGSNSPENHSIEITPTVPADFKKILVQINKSTRNLSSVYLVGNQGFSLQINFNKFQRNVNISDSSFMFNKNKYDEDIFLNDLR